MLYIGHYNNDERMSAMIIGSGIDAVNHYISAGHNSITAIQNGAILGKTYKSAADVPMINPRGTDQTEGLSIPKEDTYDYTDALLSASMNYEFEANDTAEERIAAIREVGLPKEINWNQVDIPSAYSGVLRDGGNDYSDAASYMAAQYATYKDRIDTDFTGDEHTTQIEKLDQVFAESIDKLASKAADVLGSKFGDGEKFKASIIANFETEKVKYTQYVEENLNYSGLKGTKDEFLYRDCRYTTNKLREAYTSSQTTETTDSNTQSAVSNDLYSMDELKAASTFVGMDAIPMYSGVSDEELGFSMAIADIKTDLLIKADNVGQELADKMHSSIQNQYSDFIKRYDEAAQNANESVGESYTPIDTDAVQSLYRYVKNLFDKSGDITSTILQGAEEVINRFSPKAEYITDTSRYSYPSNFITKLYIPYSSTQDYFSESPLQKIEYDWNKFVKELDVSDQTQYSFSSGTLNLIA